MAAIARGASLLRNPLDCDDSRHLSKALNVLGVPVRWEPDGSLHVTGAGGPFPHRNADVFCALRPSIEARPLANTGGVPTKG